MERVHNERVNDGHWLKWLAHTSEVNSYGFKNLFRVVIQPRRKAGPIAAGFSYVDLPKLPVWVKVDVSTLSALQVAAQYGSIKIRVAFI